jgi:hypothetical protein
LIARGCGVVRTSLRARHGADHELLRRHVRRGGSELTSRQRTYGYSPPRPDGCATVTGKGSS